MLWRRKVYDLYKSNLRVRQFVCGYTFDDAPHARAHELRIRCILVAGIGGDPGVNHNLTHIGNGRAHRLVQLVGDGLKAGGVLSILPVHLSNWRDRQGKKKTYTPKLIQSEIEEYGFSYAGTCQQKGVHWEKCHTLYYIKKGNITFDILEKVDVMNFVKK